MNSLFGFYNPRIMKPEDLKNGFDAAREDRFRNLTDSYRTALEDWILEVESILEEHASRKPGHTIMASDNKPALATLEKTAQGVRVTLESVGFVVACHDGMSWLTRSMFL